MEKETKIVEHFSHECFPSGKAERREAEVVKLQRAVVNKEGQVGLAARFYLNLKSEKLWLKGWGGEGKVGN